MTPPNVTTILLISGGSAVAINVLASLASRRDAVYLAATNSVADAAGLFEFDEVFLVPDTMTDEKEFDARMELVFDRVRPDLVIPCRDDDVLWLAKKSALSPDWARRSLCGSPELAEIVVNKHKSAAFCREHGLPFAPSIQLDAPVDELEDFVDNHGLPLVVKPSRGFASRRVFIVTSRRQFLRYSGKQGMIAQRFLGDAGEIDAYEAETASCGLPLFYSFEKDKISIQALVSPEGVVSGLFATRHRMRGGRSERVELENDEEVLALGRRGADVFAARGWRGPINIQCQRSIEGNVFITELNGRFTGATSARYVMGYDEVGLAIAAYTRCELPRVCKSDRPDVVLRIPSSCAVQNHLVERLEQEEHWQRLSATTENDAVEGETCN